MSGKKKILVLALVGLVVAAVAGYAIYNKPHQNMTKAKADHSLSSTELFAAFEADEQAANEKFLGKIVEVNGTIQEVKLEEGVQKLILEGDGMMFGVICNLDELTDSHRDDFQVGEAVSLKCECTGLLMDVVMKRCVETHS
ncbi:MAG: hypothetical protein GYB31_10655 [Bacteroidetes bacterium]|nr:hypothetical protein [Bacteroidota bacterium]